ncbi:MAG: transcriptional regulator [Actinobacteria bacterium]|jgi:DNA-binding HxlR family transcriptional regulator|nr:transcriptional regulator [Actinomycetota bacterium]
MASRLEADSVHWRSVCPIASGLDVLGDKWSLVIVRDLLEHESRTYSQFCESPEGISTNILAARLKSLTALGIIEHVDLDRPARNNAYRLTTSGLELRPILEAVARWSQKNLRELHPEIVTIL